MNPSLGLRLIAAAKCVKPDIAPDFYAGKRISRTDASFVVMAFDAASVVAFLVAAAIIAYRETAAKKVRAQVTCG
jgi:predicted RNA methylase